jgi:16S rRNA (guanine1207-N2)-methyltransferase
MAVNEPNKKRTDHYFIASPTSEEKYGLIRTCLRGRDFGFLTSASVFSKKRVDLGTRLLVESMLLPESGMVLDIGCGYGAVGVAAATFNPMSRVIMTDVNIRAVGLAKKNLELNKVANAEARYGFLYEPVENLFFDCILSNPPVSAGMQIVKAIVKKAPKVMVDKAIFEMVIRSKIGAKVLPAVFLDTFGNCSVLARESGYRVLLGTNYH